jgi:transcriptional regulator GlxA family with amidase domain
MLETVRGATPYRPSRRERAAMNRHRIVKTAEAYALSRAGERTYVSELCRAASVSERTLEYAFKATTGLTPTEYLTALRLHRVRASLQQAPRSARSVSATAFDWGFRHLGEFAQAYRQRFGELPSQTRPLERTAPTAIERRRGEAE